MNSMDEKVLRFMQESGMSLAQIFSYILDGKHRTDELSNGFITWRIDNAWENGVLVPTIHLTLVSNPSGGQECWDYVHKIAEQTGISKVKVAVDTQAHPDAIKFVQHLQKRFGFETTLVTMMLEFDDIEIPAEPVPSEHV